MEKIDDLYGFGQVLIDVEDPDKRFDKYVMIVPDDLQRAKVKNILIEPKPMTIINMHKNEYVFKLKRASLRRYAIDLLETIYQRYEAQYNSCNMDIIIKTGTDKMVIRHLYLYDYRLNFVAFLIGALNFIRKYNHTKILSFKKNLVASMYESYYNEVKEDEERRKKYRALINATSIKHIKSLDDLFKQIHVTKIDLATYALELEDVAFMFFDDKKKSIALIIPRHTAEDPVVAMGYPIVGNDGLYIMGKDNKTCKIEKNGEYEPRMLPMLSWRDVIV